MFENTNSYDNFNTDKIVENNHTTHNKLKHLKFQQSNIDCENAIEVKIHKWLDKKNVFETNPK